MGDLNIERAQKRLTKVEFKFNSQKSITFGNQKRTSHKVKERKVVSIALTYNL